MVAAIESLESAVCLAAAALPSAAFRERSISEACSRADFSASLSARSAMSVCLSAAFHCKPVKTAATLATSSDTVAITSAVRERHSTRGCSAGCCGSGGPVPGIRYGSCRFMRAAARAIQLGHTCSHFTSETFPAVSVFVVDAEVFCGSPAYVGSCSVTARTPRLPPSADRAGLQS